MAILIDTNILLRSVQPHHPQNPEVLAALKGLADAGEHLTIVPQIIVEFWTVATRPIDRNGLGMTPVQAQSEVERLLDTFSFFPETPEIFERWREIAIAYRVSGMLTHDARIVAAMLCFAIARILTFNTEDFQRFSQISACYHMRCYLKDMANASQLR